MVRKSFFWSEQLRRGWLLFFPLICLLQALTWPAIAAADAPGTPSFDPTDRSRDSSAVVYNNTNGLPTSEANAIAQTGEGFIWIGSYSGLIRYDGNTFEREGSATEIGSVMCLFVDSRDRLWIGTNENGLAMLERGEFRFWGEEDGLTSAKVNTVTEGEDGIIYVGTVSGITLIEPDMTLRALEDERIAGAHAKEIWPGPEGLLCGITGSGDYFTLADGALRDFIDHSEITVQGIKSILPDPDVPGSVYIGTEESEIYHGSLTDGGALECLDIAPLSCVNRMQVYGDQLWVCTQTGIGVKSGGQFYCLDDLPLNSLIDQLMLDYEDNLWFTSSRQGVMKLVPNRFTDVLAQNGLPAHVVNSTCMYEGQLFIGTDTGLTVLGENGPVSAVPLTSAVTASGADTGETDLLELLDGVRIRSILRDRRGRLWISTWRDVWGLLRYDHGQLVAFTVDDGLLSNRVRAVSETADGKILVACTGGMNVIEGDRVAAAYGAEAGIDNTIILCVCAAPNGDALLGSNGGGIYILSDDGLRCIDTHSGLKSGIVMHIKHDPVRRVFWLVCGNSIAYMTEDYQVNIIHEFPYSDNSDLYENSLGDMWVLSSDGIYVLPAEDLIANGALTPVHYGLANGLPCTATFNSYSELTPEGDLYIAGTSGVAKVNIETALEDITDLKQAVPYVDADGVRLYPDASGGFTLPAKVRRLTIYSYVYNYALTDPKVSYRLEGFDERDVTVNRSDLAPVTYTNLSGGSYRFVMEIKDALGRGSDNRISVPILKEKALYEQTWFLAVCVLAVLLALSVLNRILIRRKVRAMEKKHREEAERERINNELSLATQIQLDVLPNVFPAFPERTDFDIYASMDPAKEVGGDFYDFFLVDDDHLCMIMADVSGKGIPAALFMMATKIILENNAMMGKSPKAILADANTAICANNRQDMFVTVWLGILELSTGKLTAINAGHEYPVLKQPDGSFALLKDRHCVALGATANGKFTEYTLEVSPGAKLFLYTDGIPEATDTAENMFGTERMLTALNTAPDAAPGEIMKHVRDAVDVFKGAAEQFDDLTMLCLEYKGQSSAPPEAQPLPTGGAVKV